MTVAEIRFLEILCSKRPYGQPVNIFFECITKLLSVHNLSLLKPVQLMFISVTKLIHSYCHLTVKIITKLDRLGLDRYIIRKGNLIYKVILIVVNLKELYISEISQLLTCISIDRTKFAGKMIPESQHKDKLVVCWYIFVAEWSGQVLIHNFRLLYYILHSGHTVFLPEFQP